MQTIRAITFDVWDTLIVNGSDDLERRRLGLPSKGEERLDLLLAELEAHGHRVPASRLADSWAAVQDEADHSWSVEHVTWSSRDRVRRLLEWLGLDLDRGAQDRLVEAFSRMELEVPPCAVPGAVASVRRLGAEFALGLVSDTFFTPGSLLLDLLGALGFAPFQAAAFSDQIGRAKPHPKMFEAICHQLDLSPGEVVHIGDRCRMDVAGAWEFGMEAVLFTGVRDEGPQCPEGVTTCSAWASLADQLLGSR